MAATSSRTLRLLSLLQAQRFWPGEELADRLGVSLRTLRRDVERLRELGYPVAAQRGVDGGYQLAAGAAMPPLLLDDDEAVALAVGLQVAAHGGVAGIGETSVRALAKLVAVMPRRLRRRVEALREMTMAVAWDGGPAAEPATLAALALHCRGGEGVEFAYTAAGGERSDRHVEPHRLVSVGRRWYLVAYDLTRGDWRTFRLDRLTEPRATGARFAPRALPAPDAATFVRSRLRDLPTIYDVDAIVHLDGQRVRERIGRWAEVTDLDPARARVRMPVDRLEWAVFGLGLTGADFEVLAPDELVDVAREWGLRFTRATDG